MLALNTHQNNETEMSQVCYTFDPVHATLPSVWTIGAEQSEIRSVN